MGFDGFVERQAVALLAAAKALGESLIHFGGLEAPYEFAGLDQLRADFSRDLEEARNQTRSGD